MLLVSTVHNPWLTLTVVCVIMGPTDTAKGAQRLFLDLPMKKIDAPQRATDADLADHGVLLDPSDLVDFLSTPTKDGEEKVIPCHENVLRAVRSFRCVRFDTFDCRYEIRVGDTWETREDYHDIQIHSRVSNKFPFLSKLSIGSIRDAITLVGAENMYDSMQEYVQSLTWDGISRLDSWLHKTYHVEDNAYHRQIGSNWLKGVVKRIMHPGCKFDFTLIIQGKQGICKSTSLLILAGETRHAEFTELSTREFVQDIQGKLIVEFSEGAVFSKADQNTLKSIVSRQKDTFRPPYARASKDFPRRCVFAMTANNDEILKDETGNRRWWVVLTEREADVLWLTENREQLFAEAYHRVETLEESVHEVPGDELIKYQDMLRTIEQNEDIVHSWYSTLPISVQNDGVTVRMVFQGVFQPTNKNGEPIDINTINIDKRTEMSISRSLKYMGLEKRRSLKEGERVSRWFPPGVEQVTDGTF